MKKYFIKNESGQQGPFNLDELKDKGITSDTPVWAEGMENWTTAGQLEDLKELLTPPAVAEETIKTVENVITTPPVEVVTPTPVAEVKKEETVVTPAPVAATTVTAATATAAAAPKPVKPRKKGNPVLTWVLPLLILGGTGYFVYQDMEKGKDASLSTDLAVTNTTDPATNTDSHDANSSTETNTAKVDPPKEDTATATTTTTTNTTDPVVTTVTTTTDNTDAAKKAAEEKKKQAALALAKKKEEEKKKQLAAEAKKKEEEAKKLKAAQALAAEEMRLRNGWARYVTIGSYKLEGDDKVKPFAIPVNNGYNVTLDKVTVRVDYIKKEKLVHTETLTLSSIPARGSSVVQAAGNKKGHTANVYITGASSRGLNFCYPSSGGKSGDPYYCN